ETITVSDAYIISMELILTDSEIPVGGNGTYVRAEGRFSDNQRYDITSQVNFLSDNSATAVVSNTEESKGFVRGRNSGSVRISGIYATDLSASTVVQVTGVIPWSLHIMGHANGDQMPA